MIFQLQSQNSQSKEWEKVCDEYGDEVFQTLEETKSLEIRISERYPLTETRIIDSESDDWI